MKPSILNAPFDPKEYQRRMDEIVRVKHGFATAKVVAPASKVVVPKAGFYKWPAYVTPFYVSPPPLKDARLGFVGDSFVGRQCEDGKYEYIDYNGNPKLYHGGTVVREYSSKIHRFITPELCAWMIKSPHNKSIEDRDLVLKLMSTYPSLTLEEWQALPDETWPSMR